MPRAWGGLREGWGGGEDYESNGGRDERTGGGHGETPPIDRLRKVCSYAARRQRISRGSLIPPRRAVVHCARSRAVREVAALPAKCRAKNPRDAVLAALIHRSPNWVPIEMLARDVPDLTAEEIEATVNQLDRDGKVARLTTQTLLDSPPSHAIRIKDASPYQLREYIDVGGFSMRRLLANDLATLIPEHFNSAVEELAEYTEQLEERLAQQVVDQQRGYWASMVSIFGIFAGVIALIVRGVQTIHMQPGLPFCDILKSQIAQLLPLGLLLLLFVVALRYVVPGGRRGERHRR